MADTPQFPTLQALQEAHKNGTLTKENPLILDNDASYLWFQGADETEDDGEDHGWPGTGPEDLLREALTLLGIPWENC